MEIIEDFIRSENAEPKAKTLGFLKHFWYLIVIVILGIFLTFVWQSKQNLANENDSLRRQFNAKETLFELEKKVAEIQKRETEIYPQLQKKYGEYEALLKNIETKRKVYKELSKESIDNELKNANIDDLNRMFHEYGYNTKVIR